MCPVPDCNLLYNVHTRYLICCMYTASSYRQEKRPLYRQHSNQRGSVGGELVHEMYYYYTQTKTSDLIDVLFLLFHLLYCIEVHTLQVFAHSHTILLTLKVEIQVGRSDLTLVYSTTHHGRNCSISLSNCNGRKVNCFARVHTMHIWEGLIAVQVGGSTWTHTEWVRGNY